MDISKKNEIEARLRKMLEMSTLSKGSDEKNVVRHAPCNVIRRRKGEKDKRLYVK
jgi:hypothetical protein